ncbi:MAG: FtsQ-type POTRA domain-containing protein [SAR324 cluster bacterium]|nr:FtsQ-type POTRA domain-containing protein [SAR324 cluster bacterium]
MRDFLVNNPPPPKKREKSQEKTNLYRLGLGIVTLGAGLFCILGFLVIPATLSDPIKKVKVQGNKILTPAEVAAPLNLSEDDTWAGLDAYELSSRVQSLTWVKVARVKKLAGGELWVKITEQEPIAYFRTVKGLYLLSADFTLLPLRNNPQGWDLPTIQDRSNTQLKVGEKANTFTLIKSLELMAKLKDSDLLPLGSISEIDISDPLNLTISTLPLGIKIKMGFKDFDKKLDRLKRALPEISKRAKKIYSLDLRNHQGIALKYK